ncbi:hypothetical protein [Methylobacterium nodulans]|uniref:MxaH protein n=1 Tax=Methylobacterium nodulans (strain LMG 21967 / CNCM I-2342 / ORS 2060) TaxID=460265 RepID=B8IWY1_METNO|nr:hypothetical protein [Methylobacterium nodulans]ACL63022.1 conserved hypothetical protein [Methylobacterium nodulans ORS 2060]
MRRGAQLAAACLLLSACGEAGEGGSQPATVVARHDAGAMPAWLAPDDRTDPALWLAARAAGRLVPAKDPAVARLRAALARAAPRFIKDPRMIANRTAQVLDMLHAAGLPGEAEPILDGLMGIAAAAGARQLYGSLGQHYVNTRIAGAAHRDAVDRLSTKYAPQSLKQP